MKATNGLRLDHAVRAGNMAGGLPVMIDFGGSNRQANRGVVYENTCARAIFYTLFWQLDSGSILSRSEYPKK